MRRPEQRERGAATIFVLGMSIVLFVCAGLVVDGGLAIGARMRVADDAEQASRVGADSLDIDVLRDSNVIQIDEGLARSRAAGYLNERGYSAGQYDVNVDDEGGVRVVVRDTTTTMILSLVNIDTYDVEAAATSEPVTGP